ncbi:MAG: hypothetical protein ACLP51_14820 [Syntrophobacteraceae bacterium]
MTVGQLHDAIALLLTCIMTNIFRSNIMAKPRKPSDKNLSRAGKDMHNKNPKVRKEAAEVLALEPRKKRPKS